MLRLLPDSRRWLLAPVLACFAGLSACAADRISATGDSTNIITVASVRLSPATVIVPTGATIRITATPFDAAGHTVSGRTVSWRSANTSIARVDDGVVTAVSSGTTDIIASVDDVSATGSVQVEPPAVASVQVSLNSGSIAVLQQTQATAVLRDAAGNVLTGRALAWSSSNSSVATVDANGVVRGVSVGSTNIVATSEGRSASANIAVTAQQVSSITLSPSVLSTTVGQAATITATLRDAAGNVIGGRQPAWSSASTAIATVSSSGVVTGVAAGSTTITASADGVSANASVTVAAAGQPLPVMAPTTLTLPVGSAGNLTVSMRDPSGNTVPATFTWSTSNASVATVDVNGRVTGVSTGSATITATADGKSASALVTIIPVPVASVTLSPTSLALVVGQSGTVTATCRDAAGAPLTGRTVTWSSSATGVATVDAVGSVRGVSSGNATVTATCEGRTASASVAVSPVPVASVTVSPATATVSTGATVQLTATMRDASGNVLSGRSVTWTTSSAANATVSSSGLVTGVAAGSATITATSEGRSATATITVPAPAPVATVAVSPATVSLTVNATSQLTATTRDAAGAVLNGRVVTWTTSNASVATVSTSGLVRAVAIGTATITATSETRTGTSAVTVVAPPAGAAEPVFDAATQSLILRDNFDSYSNIGAALDAYPNNRGTADMEMTTGRGGTGFAPRLKYGIGGAYDIVFGPENQLGRVGGWNGTLPQKAGPYTHFFFTTWFRFSSGANPAANNGSGVKGFMFWTGSGRYQNAINQISADGQTRGPKAANPNNAESGFNLYKTADGRAPLFSTIADGQWHRFTIEIYAGNDPSGHWGERYWIDGNLIYSDIDLRVGTGTRADHYDYLQPITHWMVFGNFVSEGARSPFFTFDVDDWMAWTP